MAMAKLVIWKKPKRIGKMKSLGVVRLGREGEVEDKEGREGDPDGSASEHGLRIR